MKYRKRPVVVEAEKIRLNTIPNPHLGGWVYHNPFGVVEPRRDWPRFWRRVPMVQTPNGWVRVEPNEWIVKGVNGEFYPCKPDIFEQTYEPIPEEKA